MALQGIYEQKMMWTLLGWVINNFNFSQNIINSWTIQQWIDFKQ